MQGEIEGEDRVLKSDCLCVVILEMKLWLCLDCHQNYISWVQNNQKYYVQARGHDQRDFLLFKEEENIL